MSRILATIPAASLYGLLAGVSWHAVTLATDTARGLLEAM